MSDKIMIQDIIDKSVAAGIFEPNSVGTENYICNLNCVSKPDSSLVEFSKADKHVNQSLGLTSNKSRNWVDLRSLNDILGPTPKVRMPRTNLLKERAYGSYLSSFDMTMFFYGIKLAQESKKFTNFWYAGRSYRHSGHPMGLKSAPFYAQMVSERIFSNENLKNSVS